MPSVFSENYVMEIVPSGDRWEGHAGAEAFYEAFIGKAAIALPN